jgi:penicillin amidase
MQQDSVSLAARQLLPLLLKTRPADEEQRTALRLLAAWDGDMAADRPEPLILMAWWREATRGIFADELGDAFRAAWSTRARFVANVLADRDGQGRWCDDVKSKKRESCADVLQSSLQIALEDLARRYGKDMGRWRWGEAHEARLRHRPLTRDNWLRRWFDVTAPSPGDAYSVNVGRPDFHDDADPYGNRHASSLRAIYDLADPQASLFIHPGGQSGNPLSEHYRSFMAAWARGEYAPMLTERARIERGGVQRLLLTPRK